MVLYVDAGIVTTTINTVSVDGHNAVAGGVSSGAGVIYYSKANGSFNTWSQPASNISSTSINSVGIYGPNAIAGGTNGILFFSQDTGAGFNTWTQRTVPQNVSFTSVTIYGTNAVAVGLDGSGSGRIYYSVNSGDTWSLTTSPTLVSSTTFKSVAIYGQNAVTVGTNNKIYYSVATINGFKNWAQIPSISSTTFNSVATYGPNAVAVGVNTIGSGIIYYSIDAGVGFNAWVQLAPISGITFNSVTIYEYNAVAVGVNAIGSGVIYYSIDTGGGFDVWSPISSINGTTFNSVTIYGQNAMVVGTTLSTNGIIYYSVASSSGFDTWTMSDTPPSPNPFSSVVINNNLVSVAVGGSGIYYTQSPLCLNHDTKILCLTAEGEKYVPIQDLREGYLVKSYLHGYRKIQCIGKNKMFNDPNTWIYSMWKMEKTDTNELTEDLFTLGGHSRLVDTLSDEIKEKYKEHNWYNGKSPTIDGKLLLCSGLSGQCVQLKDTGVYTYYHFTLENDGDDNMRFGIWANGVLVEIPSKSQFNWIKWCPIA
jgi:hypothetical protein